MDTYKDPVVISFNKCTIRINILPKKCSQLMKVNPQGTAVHGSKFKYNCGFSGIKI